MKLTDSQFGQFYEDGFLVLPGLFSDTEIGHVLEDLTRLFAEDDLANFRERESGVDDLQLTKHGGAGAGEDAAER